MHSMLPLAVFGMWLYRVLTVGKAVVLIGAVSLFLWGLMSL